MDLQELFFWFTVSIHDLQQCPDEWVMRALHCRPNAVPLAAGCVTRIELENFRT